MSDSHRSRPRARGGREVILTSAIENFERLGYHGTSIRDIGRDAGITIASIYHHFPSKQAILEQIMEQALADAIALTRAAVAAAGPGAPEQLFAITKAWVLFHTDRQAEALIGGSEIRSLEPAGREKVVTLRDEQAGLFNDIVARGVQEGVFLTPIPRIAARAIINMGSSIAMWYRRGGDIAPIEMAESYAELALATVRGPRPLGATMSPNIMWVAR